ncbi:hypothetical protein M569_04927, partial [Genlisea aurea]
WGNLVGYCTLDLPKLKDDDPLEYIRRVKSTMDKKKLSYNPKIQHIFIRLVMRLFGVKAAAEVTRRTFTQLTIGASNVVGPAEEVILFGHPVNYIAPTVRGFPLALVIHYHSYGKKLVISLSVNEEVIPDPHELCDYIQKALESAKESVVKSGL